MSGPEESEWADVLEAGWHRLMRQGLLEDPSASISLRLPASTRLLIRDSQAQVTAEWDIAAPGAPTAAANPVTPPLALHAAIYRLRDDVGAIAVGGGPFGQLLGSFGGTLPQLFDEQARHLGAMPAQVAGAEERDLRAALRHGGNALLVAGTPVCLGMTCQRLLFNAELLEKCAKAWVLAVASGGETGPLPWWVRRIANGRLKRDERRAARRFAQGELPEEVKGY